MRTNEGIIAAQKTKNDEFYTQYNTIEKEIPYYADFLKNKNIYCNCDNPACSSFWKYFSDNFNAFNLKSLTATYYTRGTFFTRATLSKTTRGRKKLEIQKVAGTGDFSSEEAIKILKKPDTVVITNPPFSKAKEFIPLMYQYDIPFIILGNQNVLTFREVYPRILSGNLYLGVSIHSGDVEFEIPEDYELSSLNTTVRDGKKYARVTAVRWLTNINHGKHPGKMDLKPKSWHLENNLQLRKKLISSYGVLDYPLYSNFPAIEVPFSNAIPSDYDGVFGVPISFFDKYSPQQFRFVGFRKGLDGKDLNINGKTPYFRFLIQRTRGDA